MLEQAIAQLVGQTHLPLLSGMGFLGTEPIRDAHLRAMVRHHFVNDCLTATRANDMQTDLLVLKHPLPLILALYTGASLIATDEPDLTQMFLNLGYRGR